MGKLEAFFIITSIAIAVGFFVYALFNPVERAPRTKEDDIRNELSKLNSQFSHHVKSLEADRYRAISPYNNRWNEK
jgi:hypothetical protein